MSVCMQPEQPGGWLRKEERGRAELCAVRVRVGAAPTGPGADSCPGGCCAVRPLLPPPRTFPELSTLPLLLSG